jgi:hypothetical protein
MRWAWLAALAMTSCFNVSLGDEPFVCGAGESCPGGYECVFNVCSRIGRPDAGIPDGSVETDATCSANELIACVGDNEAQVCNGEGTGILTVDCPGGCDETSGLCVRCDANVVACAGDTRLVCGPSGEVVESTTCYAGCDPTPPASCLVLVPSNLPDDVCQSDQAGVIEVVSEVTYDTTDCPAIGGELIAQGDETGTETASICLVRTKRLLVREGATLKVRGAYVLAIVATDRIEVSGVLDVSADGLGEGPGGLEPQGKGGNSGLSNNGGGGAGYLTPGGRGGQGGTPMGMPRAQGGSLFGDETIVPLVGGAAGGTGGLICGSSCAAADGRGGGGGGGLQLVACQRFSIGNAGRVDGNGGGGPGGFQGSPSSNDAGVSVPALGGGGAGGGSGGSLLIEAPAIVVPNGAKLTAVGGGGGGGAVGTQKGGAGEDGLEENPGAGGTTPSGGGAGGVAGGNDEPRPGEDARNVANVAGGGGGGGAAGRIRLNARPDVEPVVSAGARVVPAASKGSISRKRAGQ